MLKGKILEAISNKEIHDNLWRRRRMQ